MRVTVNFPLDLEFDPCEKCVSVSWPGLTKEECDRLCAWIYCHLKECGQADPKTYPSPVLGKK